MLDIPLKPMTIDYLERPNGGYVIAEEVGTDDKGEPFFRNRLAEIIDADFETVLRIVAAVNFCAGAPLDQLQVGGLLKSYKRVNA